MSAQTSRPLRFAIPPELCIFARDEYLELFSLVRENIAIMAWLDRSHLWADNYNQAITAFEKLSGTPRSSLRLRGIGPA